MAKRRSKKRVEVKGTYEEPEQMCNATHPKGPSFGKCFMKLGHIGMHSSQEGLFCRSMEDEAVIVFQTPSASA